MTPSDDEEIFYKPVKRLWTKMRVDNLWLYICRLLLERPYYAYELKEEIRERFGFEPATVTSYAVLYRLERSDFVEESNNTLAPNRKYYQITEKGKDALLQAEEMIEKTQYELFGNEEFWPPSTEEESSVVGTNKEEEEFDK